MPHIPLFVDPKGLNVVVFGGGKVGARRARMFAEAGARVYIAALDFSKEAEELSRRGLATLVRLNLLEQEGREEARKLIERSDMVVVATSSPEANKTVYMIASSMGKLINNAADSSKGNVVVPFAGRAGGFYVAVTTLGESSIAAKHALRKALETLGGDESLQALLSSLSRIKRELKLAIKDPKKRMALYRAIEADKDFWEAVNRGDGDEAYKRAKRIVEEHAGEV